MVEPYTKRINQRHTEFFMEIPWEKQSRERCERLYKQWKRDYPKGIGGIQVVALKKAMTGFTPVDLLDGMEWRKLLTAIEYYYSKLDRRNRHGQAAPDMNQFVKGFLEEFES